MSEKNIFVKSSVPRKTDGGAEIVLMERDARHPKGAAVVSAPDKWTEVHPTALVREQITKGRLIEAKGEDAEDARAAADEAAEAKASGKAGRRSRTTPTAEKSSDATSEKSSGGSTSDRNAPFEMREGDTAETLDARYNLKPLQTYADEKGIEVGGKKTKADYIEAILQSL